LFDRLDPIFRAVASLVEMRIVQDGVNHVRVEFAADESVEDTEKATLVGELRNRLGPSMQIDLLRVPPNIRHDEWLTGEPWLNGSGESSGGGDLHSTTLV
jgi:hypothetical protein